MPSGTDKLQAVLLQSTAAERESSAEVRRVSDVFERRSLRVEELLALERESVRRIQKCQRERQLAAHAGDFTRVRQLAGFESQLRKSRVEQTKELERAQTELGAARLRLDIVEAEFRQSVVERKKIEQLISQRARSQRIVQHARDEVSQEELIQSIKTDREE